MVQMEMAEAQGKLAELVNLAEAGETVCLVKDGATVAHIVAAERSPAPRKPIDVEALRRFAATMPYQEEGAGDFIRRMRDEDRY